VGIGRGDDGPETIQLYSDVECGRVADVVRLRLERETENGHLFLERFAAEHVNGQVDDGLSSTQVDGIDFIEEAE
jgi:hypothetical protein